jgi:hypothetical protein
VSDTRSPSQQSDDEPTVIKYVCPTIGCECEGQGLAEDEGEGLFCSLCLRDLVPMETIASTGTQEPPR